MTEINKAEIKLGNQFFSGTLLELIPPSKIAFGPNVSYAILFVYRPAGQIVAWTSEVPIPIPAIGETVQLQPVPSVSGVVNAVHHVFSNSTTTPPFLTHFAYVYLA